MYFIPYNTIVHVSVLCYIRNIYSLYTDDVVIQVEYMYLIRYIDIVHVSVLCHIRDIFSVHNYDVVM